MTQTFAPQHPAQPVQGKVWLVGAGPGDPELLTLKAVRVMGQATLILVDDLVNSAVLVHASPGARIVQVGKRGGCKSTPQAFIDRLMVTEALGGEQVVRLKGGDPFLFGRGGEEVEALEAAGVAVEVVNGITAGLAAATALCTPLTHRDHAHGVVFITGHAKPGDSGVDWAALAKTAAQARLSVVIYMGVSGVANICAGLLHGLNPETPVAVVQSASLPEQRELHTTLGELAHELASHDFASPSVLLIGDVFAARQAMTAQKLGRKMKQIPRC